LTDGSASRATHTHTKRFLKITGGAHPSPAGHTQLSRVNPTAGDRRQSLTDDGRLTHLTSGGVNTPGTPSHIRVGKASYTRPPHTSPPYAGAAVAAPQRRQSQCASARHCMGPSSGCEPYQAHVVTECTARPRPTHRQMMMKRGLLLHAWAGMQHMGEKQRTSTDRKPAHQAMVLKKDCGGRHLHQLCHLARRHAPER
jgi:hypothetical protein